MGRMIGVVAVVFGVFVCGLPAREVRPAARVRPPVISPAGGHFGLNEQVTVSIRAEPDCGIIYTTDGRYPAEGRGTKVDNNLAFFTLPPGDVTVMAIAVRPGLPRSSTSKAEFTRSGGAR